MLNLEREVPLRLYYVIYLGLRINDTFVARGGGGGGGVLLLEDAIELGVLLNCALVQDHEYTKLSRSIIC